MLKKQKCYSREACKLFGRATIFFCSVVLLFGLLISDGNAASTRHGGTFIYAIEGEESMLNPALGGGSSLNPIAQNVFNMLLTRDFNMNFVPQLAQSYKVSSDGLTYTFNLVKNATWHDGKPFTSADVVFTLATIYPLSPRAGSWWEPNVNVVVEAPDQHTVVLKLKKPYAPLLDLLAFPVAGPYMMPKHLYEGTDVKTNPYNYKPVGTGPFVFKEWVKGSHVEFVRNKNYFGAGKEGKPYIDRLVFRVVPDPAVRIMALKKGEIDYIYSEAVPLEYVADLRKDSNIVVDNRGQGPLTLKWLFFNLRNPPLSNKYVRQAIAHAIDRKVILDLALLGEGTIAKSILSSRMTPYFNPKAPDYPYDPQKANTLLDKAGYPRGADGTRFKQRLLSMSARGSEGRIGEIVRDQLKQVGIDAQIIATDRASFVNTMFINWDFDMAIQQGATGPDPMVGSTRFIHSKRIQKVPFVNATAFTNAEVDKLLDEEFLQVSMEKRAAMWHRIQEIVMDELPMLPIYEQPMVNTHRAVWVDTITGPYANFQSLEHAYMKK